MNIREALVILNINQSSSQAEIKSAYRKMALELHPDKNNLIIVLAWNFYNEIKNNNSDLSNNFINIKDLEKN